MFLSNPNFPDKKVESALIDYRADRAKEALISLGINVIKTPALNIAYNSISGHPDIIFHQLDEINAVVLPEAKEYFEKKFTEENIICGGIIGRTYPYDIAYNVARIGGLAIHNVKYTDKTILEYYNKKGTKLINVSQGYSKCSVCMVSENAIITADKGIEKAAKINNIDVLLIKNGFIKLKDFGYNGFIGGASGYISEEIIAFNGKIERHPDYENIKSFLSNYKKYVYSLHDGDLEDIGSIIPIKS